MGVRHRDRTDDAPLVHGLPIQIAHRAGRSWLWAMDADFIHIGQRQIWGGEAPLRLSRADRRQHLYLIGQSGAGKSTFLRQVVVQDIQNGDGCALIDPHGDLAEEVLAEIPRHRIDDVIVLDPSQRDVVVPINPLFRVPKEERALVASNLVATMKHIWRDSWGPRLEYILFNTVRALLDVKTRQLRPTLLSVPRLFVDDAYRQRVVQEVDDPGARRFFEAEFARWNERQLTEALSPVQNKLGQFLANPYIAGIFGSWRPKVDFSEVLEQGRVLIVRVPKGSLGEDPANLLGSVVVANLFQAATRRERMPEAERRDFHLVIDEFHNFTTDAFASILSEARKYALSLTCGHQYLDQLSETVQSAVFGNVGSLLSFRVSGADADRLAREVGEYPPAAYRDLGRGEIRGRLLEEGQPGPVFYGRVERLARAQSNHAAKIKAQSRQRYSEPLSAVEGRVRDWLCMK